MPTNFSFSLKKYKYLIFLNYEDLYKNYMNNIKIKRKKLNFFNEREYFYYKIYI